MFKLFNGKKNDFFLELKEEAQNIISNITESDSTEPAEEQKHVEAEKEETTEPKAETVTEEKKAEPVAAKKTKKVASKTATVAKVESKPAPAPVEETPAWVKALYKTNSQKETEDPTFATKYLIDSSMSRRRPGPSLTGFKGMARQMKRG